MSLFVAKVITATRSGSRIQTIICDKCKTTYHYELTRTGVGKGSAPYYLGQGGAAKRAESAAENDLARRLATDSEMVPCPKCNWVNLDLVKAFRRQRYRRAGLLVFLLIVVGLLAASIIGTTIEVNPRLRSQTSSYIRVALLAACLTSPIWVLLIRRQLRLRIDPNLTYPRRPMLPPGTPPALLEQRDPRTGKSQLVVVASESESSAGLERWAIFQAGRLRLPRFCCVCMEPATTVYRSPMPINDKSEQPVPLCYACSVQLRRRWWLTAFGVVVLLIAIAGLLAFNLPGVDAVGREIMFTIFGCIGGLVGGILFASWFCRPYRMGYIDRDRAVMKFAAVNRQYTALMIEQTREAEGVGTG